MTGSAIHVHSIQALLQRISVIWQDGTYARSEIRYNYRISYYFVHIRIEIWTFSDSILTQVILQVLRFP